MGGSGIISVLSNVMPAQTVEICTRFWQGDIAGSAALQCQLMPLIKALFSETNPIPVKAAMHAMGFGENYLRLPLTTMEPAHEAVLLDLMRGHGLIG
jgi:4-hydroxy-tetrahydrodipicolinate synthase